jgi:hypothetical protein
VETSKRPATLICAVNRAPLLPMGSFNTWTINAWPSKIWRSMGSTGSGANTLGLPCASLDAASLEALSAGARSRGIVCLAAMLGIRSATCKKAARSSPMSMNADCMPGKTLDTLPR